MAFRHWIRGGQDARPPGSRAVVIALIALGVFVLIALLADVLAPQDPSVQDLAARNRGPSGQYLLGADLFGRDVLSRLLVGIRISLLAVVIAFGVAVVIGVPIGLLSGYFGGVLDGILSRLNDAIIAFPGLILALAIVSVAGPGLVNSMVAIGIVLSPRLYRLARVESAAVARTTFVEAARADGCSPWMIIRRHVLPNVRGPLLVQGSFLMCVIVMAEAGLSFLGLGVQPPTPSLGSMLRESFSQLSDSAFQIFPPAILVVVLIYIFTIVGDGLQDASQTKSRTAT
ncbi:MAG: ABC transporter permease subunit [Actinophytocola sp.]|uniref:ABC transporter permease n=1 Tax=Actinophytocola sp. TaxID=1872138 RepID=UPI0013255F86|nr:ABC transporter permease [Actinophytocola sp.]MPZ80091.1 ABC transporter permease subunit [Actinophytocola sp.]